MFFVLPEQIVFMIRIQDLKSIIVFLKSELFEHQYFASELNERLQITFYEFFHPYVFPVDFFRIVLNNTTSYFAIFQRIQWTRISFLNFFVKNEVQLSTMYGVQNLHIYILPYFWTLEYITQVSSMYILRKHITYSM